MALQQSPTIKAINIENALMMATSYGLRDLVDKCRRELRPAILESSQHMTALATDLTIPVEYLKAIDEIVDRETEWSSAIRAIALIPFIIAAPVATFRSVAEQRVASSPLWSMIKSGRYRDGKISFEADDPESKKKEAMAEGAEIHLAIVLRLLGHFLASTRDRWNETGLFDALAAWPLMDAKRTPFMARASERFAHEDWISSGTLILSQYEGLLRDLARASGHHAMKGDGGSAILMDETLNSLVRSPHLLGLLGNDHLWWVEFLVCNPELGPNLRNESAHSNLDADVLGPPLVLLLWLLTVRLTFYRPDPT